MLLLALLVLLVAALYSSVGHGGASGYLAVLALLSVPAGQAAVTALILNVLVAGIAAFAFARAGHLRLKLLWPLIAVSIPCAFLGGSLSLPERLIQLVLAAVLLYAALLLLLRRARGPMGEAQSPRWPLLLASGGGIGLLSGLVGIGGGIFLSPLLVLLRWAGLRQAAALSAVFIVVNSIAGLAARALKGPLELGPQWPLLIAALAGGLLGSRFGALIAPSYLLRILLALVMLAATIKLVLA